MNPYFNGKFKPIEKLEFVEEQKAQFGEEKVQGDQPIKRGEKILVPDSMLERLIVLNHINKAHGALDTELKGLADYEFILPEGVKVKDIVERLREKCIHCLRLPAMIRRPLQFTYLASEPKQFLHSDWFQINDAG